MTTTPRTIEIDLTESLLDTRRAILTITPGTTALVNGWLVEHNGLGAGFSVNNSANWTTARNVAREVGRRRGPLGIVAGKVEFIACAAAAISNVIRVIAERRVDEDAVDRKWGNAITAAAKAAGRSYDDVKAEFVEALAEVEAAEAAKTAPKAVAAEPVQMELF